MTMTLPMLRPCTGEQSQPIPHLWLAVNALYKWTDTAHFQHACAQGPLRITAAAWMAHSCALGMLAREEDWL